jgi:hypothetical protein
VLAVLVVLAVLIRLLYGMVEHLGLILFFLLLLLLVVAAVLVLVILQEVRPVHLHL